MFNYEGKTSGIKNFQFDTFIANSWYLPQDDILSKFQIFIEQTYRQKEHLINENIQFIKLRDELLPLLMNGQVSVNGD